MDRLTSLEIFCAVSEAGSFSAVAERFAMTPAMIGKYIKALESRTGVRLLNRNTRRQSLTEAGREYLAGCREVLRHYHLLEQEMQAHNGQAAGLVRINAPITFGTCQLTPLLCDFMAQHPQIRVELHLSDSLDDVVGSGADLLVRVGALKDASYICRPLTFSQHLFCATPAYLARHGTPTRLADLEHHRCLGFLPWQTESPFSQAFPLEHLHLTRSPLLANQGQALKVAALHHAGILLQPFSLVQAELARGDLLEILADQRPPPRPIHLLYPSRAPLPLRLQLLIDYLLARGDGLHSGWLASSPRPQQGTPLTHQEAL